MIKVVQDYYRQLFLEISHGIAYMKENLIYLFYPPGKAARHRRGEPCSINNSQTPYSRATYPLSRKCTMTNPNARFFTSSIVRKLTDNKNVEFQSF